jgi:preprotein translocase subunit SecG
MGYLSGFLSIVYVCSCLFLIFVVLIQKGEGGGLGGAFGGGAVDVAFGSTADTTWKKATSIAAGLFIVLSIVLGMIESPNQSRVAGALGGEKPTSKPANKPIGGATIGNKKPQKAEQLPGDEKNPKKSDSSKPEKKGQ